MSHISHCVSYVSHWRMIQNLKKSQFVVSKMTKIRSEHSKGSKLYTLIGTFRAKYIMFNLKKYRGVIFHDTEESSKYWRKTDLWFGKWPEEVSRLICYYYCTTSFNKVWTQVLRGVQILLEACGRFAMVRIPDNNPGWK